MGQDIDKIEPMDRTARIWKEDEEWVGTVMLYDEAGALLPDGSVPGPEEIINGVSWWWDVIRCQWCDLWWAAVVPIDEEQEFPIVSVECPSCGNRISLEL